MRAARRIFRHEHQVVLGLCRRRNNGTLSRSGTCQARRFLNFSNRVCALVDLLHLLDRDVLVVVPPLEDDAEAPFPDLLVAEDVGVVVFIVNSLTTL